MGELDMFRVNDRAIGLVVDDIDDIPLPRLLIKARST